jgi:hypothetical protein
MRTTLSIEIDYDPAVTDPESLATAADGLLQTVRSTPNTLDEYGNPRFGDFFVCPDEQMQKPPLVVVVVEGGVLQTAFADGPVKIALVDFDTEGCVPAEENNVYDIAAAGHESEYAYVVEIYVTPIDEIVGTDAEKALKLAKLDPFNGRSDEIPQQSRRWVLYNFNTDTLVGSRAYHAYDEAVADMGQANDILALPVVIGTGLT